VTNFFPTASNVAIFVNGVHLELGYQLQYRETVNKIPIYGYNDHTYSKIAVGKQMIEGILVVNFSFAGYLNVVLDTLYNDRGAYVPRLYNYDFSEKTEQLKTKLENSIKQQLRTELPPNADTDTRSARASYIASLITKDKNTRDATIRALEREFYRDIESTRIQHLYSPLAVKNDNIVLDIYYQDPTYATWFQRFENVHFYQVSQSASQAGAEGSSDPLYEIYSWIASERKIKLIQEVT